MSPVKDYAKDLGGLLFHGCISCLTSGPALSAMGIATGGALPALLGFASSVTGSFASGHAGGLLSFEKLKSRLKAGDPNKVNHDLERVFKEAAIVSISFIRKLFLAELKNDSGLLFGMPEKKRKEILSSAEDFLRGNEKNLREYITDEPVDKLQIKQPAEILNYIIDYVIGVSEIELDDAIKERLRDFYTANLSYCFDLAFKEALKSDDKGFKAFQIWTFENLQTQNTQVVAIVQQLQQAIESLREGKDLLPAKERDAILDAYAEEVYQHMAKDFEEIKTILLTLSAEIKESFQKQFAVSLSIKDDTTVIRTVVTENRDVTGAMMVTVTESAADLKLMKERLEEVLLQKQPAIVHIPFLQNTKKRNVAARFFHAASLKGDSVTVKQKVIDMLDDRESSHITVLHGMGGIGKSYLAQEIANHFCKPENKSVFDTIWWIDAAKMSCKSDDPEMNGTGDLLNLAKELKSEISIDVQQKGWLKEELLSHLTGKRNFLLIYDNACDGDSREEITPEDFVSYYLPDTNTRNQQIIITTRNKRWKRDNEMIEMKEWTMQDYRQYFEKAGIAIDDENLLERLYNQLGGLALAAAIAAAYLKENRDKNLQSYVEELETLGGLDMFTKEVLDSKYYQKSVANAVLIAYGGLSSDAKSLFNQLVLMSPDEIPLLRIFPLLKKCADAAHNNSGKPNNLIELSADNPFATEDRVQDARKELEKAALITYVSEKDKEHAVHRLVRFSLQQKLLNEKALEKWVNEVVKVFSNSTDDFRMNEYTYYREILPQVEAFTDFLLARQNETKSDLVKNPQISKAFLSLLRNAGKYCFEAGNVSMALRFFRQGLILAKGDENLIHKINLDKLYGLMLRDENEEAMALAEKALDYYEHSYNEADKLESIIDSRNKVAKVFQRIGEFEKAKANIDACLLQLNQSGNDELIKNKLSGLLHDKAAIWWDEGIDQKRAIELFEESIKHKINKQGANDTDIYLNVSRMIKGVAHVLEGDYGAQKEYHKIAFASFSAQKDREYRRYAYTAFYLLQFAWDELGWKRRHEAKDNPDIEKYLKQYCMNEKMLEGDIKYMLIKAIVGLRVAVREDDVEAAKTHYKKLIEFLEKKKHSSRYIDDGTIAVSALLDYALYLKDKKLDSAEAVLQKAQEMLEYRDADRNVFPIRYHRSQELREALG